MNTKPVRIYLIAFFQIIFLLFLISASSARVNYVSPDGVPDGTGASWEAAFNTITAGLTVSASGDEIWIQSATYSESISLKEGVRLYGGFLGNETSRTDRNWHIHETVIVGQGGPVVKGVDHAILDGFIIRGGRASNGGGVYCKQASPVLNNCIITDNRVYSLDIDDEFSSGYGYGGGVYCFESSPTLNNCSITNNTAYYIFESCGEGYYIFIMEGKGGGLYCYQSSPKLNNCIIAGNSTNFGGGLCCDDSFPILTNCTIVNNIAESDCSSYCCVQGNGGGVHSESASVTTLINSIIINPGLEFSYSWNGYGSSVKVTYSCVAAYGDGNIASDPLFVDAADGDYHLQEDSPCVDAGNPDTSFNDACLPPGLGSVRNDMGAYGGPGNCGGVPAIPTATPTPTATPDYHSTPTPTPLVTPLPGQYRVWVLDGMGRVEVLEENTQE